jgi:hypothetical protein
LIALAASNAHRDYGGDGLAERTGWVKAMLTHRVKRCVAAYHPRLVNNGGYRFGGARIVYRMMLLVRVRGRRRPAFALVHGGRRQTAQFKARTVVFWVQTMYQR